MSIAFKKGSDREGGARQGGLRLCIILMLCINIHAQHTDVVVFRGL